LCAGALVAELLPDLSHEASAIHARHGHGSHHTLNHTHEGPAPITVADISTLSDPISPESGWWWAPSEPGRGLIIERSGGQMFVALLGYADDGRADWQVSSGEMRCHTDYSGTLLAYAGGQSLRGDHRAPASLGAVGPIELRFTANTTAELTLPNGRMVEIERFVLPSSPVLGAFEPQAGWWWSADEPGRGFGIEQQNGTLMITGAMYDGDGNAIWYLSMGGMTAERVYQGTWVRYGGGQTLGGDWRAATTVEGDAGAVTLQFSDESNAVLTLPTGRQIALTRFDFASEEGLFLEMPVASEDMARNFLGLWPFGAHGSSHALDGHPGWDVEFRIGTSVRAAYAGTVYNVHADSNGSGNYSIRVNHTHGGRTYATDYTNIATLASGIVSGASVTTGQALGTAGTIALQRGSSTVSYAMTHLQFNDFSYSHGLTNQNALSPGTRLSPAARAVFDRLWEGAAYNQEICEPFPDNTRDFDGSTISRSWRLVSGGLVARIVFTCTPTAGTYAYAFKDANDATTETGTVQMTTYGVAVATMDLTPSGGTQARRGVFDIMCSRMRLDYGAAGASRPSDLSTAAVYVTEEAARPASAKPSRSTATLMGQIEERPR
jgi:hypothetical protein